MEALQNGADLQHSSISKSANIPQHRYHLIYSNLRIITPWLTNCVSVKPLLPIFSLLPAANLCNGDGFIIPLQIKHMDKLLDRNQD